MRRSLDTKLGPNGSNWRETRLAAEAADLGGRAQGRGLVVPGQARSKIREPQSLVDVARGATN